MGTKVNSNYEDLITFTRASRGHALRPVSYGSELVDNGTFNSDVSGWTSSAYSLSLSSNALNVAYNGQTYGNFFGSTGTLEAGKVYELTYEVISASQASNFWLATAGNAPLNKAVGTHTISWVQTSTASSLSFYVDGIISGESITLDNISVKEVLFDQPDGTLTLFEHPDNVPRVEWDADGNRLGLLVEEPRTNLLTYSEDFTVQSGRWANGQKGDTSLTSGLTESPSMSDSVWKLFATSGTGTQIIQEDATVSGATNVVGSVYLKKAEYKYGGIRLLDSSPNTGYSVFIDLDDGSVFDTSTRGTPTTSNYRVQDAGNGWWRLSVITSSDGGSVNFTVGISDGTSINSFNCVSFAGDGTSGIYIWGAQVEEGLFPTSYMKNEGTASGKDRSADVASIPVADFGYNTEVGSVVAEYLPIKVDSTIRSVFELAKDNNDRLYSSSSTSKHWFVKSGGTDQASLDLGSSTEDQLNKIAGAYKQNDFAASLDGGSVTTDTSGVVQTGITDLHIGGIKNATQFYLNGHIKSIKYYPRRLTNAQLQDLTS